MIAVHARCPCRARLQWGSGQMVWWMLGVEGVRVFVRVYLFRNSAAAGLNCVMEVCGVGMHRMGMQIVFRCDV